MKKAVLLSMLMCMTALSLSASDAADEKRSPLHVSGTSYYMFGASSSEILGNVAVGYNFSNGWGVSANGYMSNLSKSDKTYGGSLDVFFDSMRDDKLYLIPSAGVGVLEVDNDVRVTGNMGVKLHYNVNKTLFCELETKAMLSKDCNIFMLGVTIGVNL